MKESIILVGGGGHCKSCIEIIESQNIYKIEGVVDGRLAGKSVMGYPVLGSDSDLPLLVKKYKNAVISVGQIKTSETRQKIYKELKKLGATLPVIIASTAIIGRDVILEEGTVVFHNSILNTEVKVGVCGIVNSNSLIEHESCVGDFCHISTGALINGQVWIGNSCFIGSGSILRNNINISDNSFVPMGSVVKKDC